MNQQSAFVRFHRNWLGLSPKTSQNGELGIQTKTANCNATNCFTGGTNLYLQSLQQEDPIVTNSAKKERKIKVFGIPENRIRREEPIPEPFDNVPEIEKSQNTDQMLIDSNLQIDSATLIDEKKVKKVNHEEIDGEDQLQRLLYFSGSQASILPPEIIAQSNKAQSIRTQEIDQILQIEIPNKEKESITPSKINIQIKNTESSYLAEEPKSKISQKSKIIEKIGSNSRLSSKKDINCNIDENSKILEVQKHLITEQQILQEMNSISPIPNKYDRPIPNKYDQMVQTSMWIDQPKEVKVTNKQTIQKRQSAERPFIPLPKKVEKVDQYNIKNYLQSYGSYEQQIQKMINKFQKVADLKDKEKVIKRELQTLTHKKHQSVGSIDYQLQSNIKTHTPQFSTQKQQNIHIFAQSASNFIPSKEPQPQARNSIERDLKKDVVKMQKIINKCKEISHIIFFDGSNSEQKDGKYQRSQKNFRSANYSNPLMFQSEKLPMDSIELPNYSCKKTSSQPQIYLNIKDKMVLNESQEIESDNYMSKGKGEVTSRNGQRPSILPYYTNTVRTEKKPLHGLIEKCESRYDLELHHQNQCEGNHVHLAQEIAKLNQKIQNLEKQKKIKEAQSLDRLTKNKPISIEEDEGSLQQESSFFQLLPKQKEESIQSIKTKIGKQNPHVCSNLQPVSILKPTSTLKQPASILKNEDLRYTPTQTKRKTSKDLPPKPKNISKSPQIKKEQTKQNRFSQDINVNNLKLNFPSIVQFLNIHSSECSIIQFGERTFSKLFLFAVNRKGLRDAKLQEKSGFKIKKYQDCIHYYLHNSLNYHLICYFRGKLYFGQLKDSNGDCKHGFGYYFTPKYTYEGQFAKDKKSGKGTINYSNGDMYQGSWLNSKKEGHGILINLVGDIFKGQFYNGKKNGKGEQRLQNGDFYRGDFKDGKLEGEGIYWWADGSVYKGGFKAGLLHGQGVWRSKENDFYEGQYRQNKKHGKGIYKWSNGMIFTGVFEADQQISTKKVLTPDIERKDSKSGQKVMRTRLNSGKKISTQSKNYL